MISHHDILKSELFSSHDSPIVWFHPSESKNQERKTKKRPRESFWRKPGKIREFLSTFSLAFFRHSRCFESATCSKSAYLCLVKVRDHFVLFFSSSRSERIQHPSCILCVLIARTWICVLEKLRFHLIGIRWLISPSFLVLSLTNVRSMIHSFHFTFPRKERARKKAHSSHGFNGR